MDYGFCERAAECGLRSFIIMAGALDCLSVKPTFYSYEGPFGVGYGVVGFDIGEKDPTRNFGEQAKKYEEEKILAIRKAEDRSLCKMGKKCCRKLCDEQDCTSTSIKVTRIYA